MVQEMMKQCQIHSNHKNCDCRCKCFEKEAEKECKCPPSLKSCSGVRLHYKNCSPAPVEWEDQVKIIINSWVKRLVNFGHIKEVKQNAGYTVYECPDLHPFISHLLQSEREKVLDEVKERVIGEDRKCPVGDYQNPLCLVRSRNEFRAEQRKALAEMRGKE